MLGGKKTNEEFENVNNNIVHIAKLLKAFESRFEFKTDDIKQTLYYLPASLNKLNSEILEEYHYAGKKFEAEYGKDIKSIKNKLEILMAQLTKTKTIGGSPDNSIPIYGQASQSSLKGDKNLSSDEKDFFKYLYDLDKFEERIKLGNSIVTTDFIEFCEKLLNLAKEIQTYTGTEKKFFGKERLNLINQIIFQGINEQKLSPRVLQSTIGRELFFRALAIIHFLRRNLKEKFNFIPITIEKDQKFDASDRKYVSIGIIKTGNENKDFIIAELIAYGYEVNRELLLPCQVKVYRYENIVKTAKINSILPNFAFKGQNVELIISGENFENDLSAIKLVKNLGKEIEANKFYVISSKRINVSFSINNGVASGFYDLIIENKDKKKIKFEDSFNICLPAPRINYIKPSEIFSGEKIEINIHGENFLKDTKVYLKREDIYVNIENVLYESSELIKIIHKFNEPFKIGKYDILVVNESCPSYPFERQKEDIIENFTTKQSYLYKEGLRFINPLPEVKSIVPDFAFKGQRLMVKLLGHNFSDKLSSFELKNEGLIIEGKRHSFSSNEILLYFEFSNNIQEGIWDLIITDSSGETITLNKTFTVCSPAPVLNKIKPQHILLGEEREIIFEGNNFKEDAEIYILNRCTGNKEVIKNIIFESPEILKAKINFTDKNYIGDYDMLLENPGNKYLDEFLQDKKIFDIKQSFYVENFFSILSALPEITLLSPSEIKKEKNLEVILQCKENTHGISEIYLKHDELFLKDSKFTIEGEEIHVFFNTDIIPFGTYDILVKGKENIEIFCMKNALIIEDTGLQEVNQRETNYLDITELPDKEDFDKVEEIKNAIAAEKELGEINTEEKSDFLCFEQEQNNLAMFENKEIDITSHKEKILDLNDKPIFNKINEEKVEKPLKTTPKITENNQTDVKIKNLDIMDNKPFLKGINVYKSGVPEKLREDNLQKSDNNLNTSRIKFAPKLVKDNLNKLDVARILPPSAEPNKDITITILGNNFPDFEKAILKIDNNIIRTEIKRQGISPSSKENFIQVKLKTPSVKGYWDIILKSSDKEYTLDQKLQIK